MADHVRHALLLLAVTLLMAACGGDETSNNDSENATTPTADAGADATVDPDATTNVEPGCDQLFDCPDGEFCVDGTCQPSPAECEDNRSWRQCVSAFEETYPDLAVRAVCRDQTCQLSCWSDADCPDGESCTDNGLCVAYEGDLTVAPPGDGSRKPLEVGVGEAPLNFPMGISLAGYGSRSLLNGGGKYAASMRATHGMYHELDARAVLLDNGVRNILFVRLPIIFPTMALHEAIAQRLQEQTGANWRDALILTGTHTHSGPARYWHLPPDPLFDLGSLGVDQYHQQAFEWMLESSMAAIDAAFDSKAPGAFGWTIVEAYDEDDAIASDRWEQTPPFDDNRLLLLRVDDAEGTPRAVIVSLGIHGTYNDSDYFTGDSSGGIERGLEAALGEAYDASVPVLFLNEAGGTMSPRGGRYGHRSAHIYESLGVQFAERAIGPIMAIETDSDVELDSRTHRFELGLENVGYRPDEWTGRNTGLPDGAQPHGAIQCFLGDDDDFSTYSNFTSTFCLPVHQITHNAAPTLFYKSQVTAMNLDGLTAVTAPGEVAMEVAWQILREARDRSGYDPLQSWVFGYAQDHQFYIMPTNLRGELPPFPGISTPQAPDDYPDFAFSWLQGGYETSVATWGLKMGDFIVEQAAVALEILAGTPVDTPNVYPQVFAPYNDEPFPIDATTDAGTITTDVPATVERFEPVEIAWIGGDPGAEIPFAPTVTLEREVEGSFEPVVRESRRIYDNREPVMLTRLRRADEAYEWVVRWEETKAFPAGTYRFRIEGHYWDGSDVQPYATTSANFQLVPSNDIAATVAITNGQFEGTLAYPAAPPLEFVSSEGDPGAVSGSFRMRHPLVGTGIADPLVAGEDVIAADLVIEYQSGGQTRTLDPATITLQTAGEPPVTTFTAPAPSGGNLSNPTISVTDAHGNTTP
jgi:hypothetical protein